MVTIFHLYYNIQLPVVFILMHLDGQNDYWNNIKSQTNDVPTSDESVMISEWPLTFQGKSRKMHF